VIRAAQLKSNTPSIEPIDFTATGVLAGGTGCNGQFTFHGQMNKGADVRL
jgi:hypothetical protein